jgi:nucleoside-diphosphate kinase
MALQRTLSIIKPDAVAKGVAGKIIARFEAEGFRLRAVKMVCLTKTEAEGFYAVHRGKPFFGSLTDFMSSGPAIVMALEADDAIGRNRQIMGATNPANAEPGTLRKEFAANVEQNAVHGSDAPETAATEIAYFFNALEMCPR